MKLDSSLLGKNRYIPEAITCSLLNAESGFECGLRVFIPVTGEENILLTDEQTGQFQKWGMYLTAELDGIFEVVEWNIKHAVPSGQESLTIILRQFEADASFMFDLDTGITEEQKQKLTAMGQVDFFIGYQTSNGVRDLYFDCFHLLDDVVKFCVKNSITIDADYLVRQSMDIFTVMEKPMFNSMQPSRYIRGV